MTKRLMLTTLAVVLVVGFTACGGNGSNGPTPLPTPTPPTQAAVTFNVDPNPVVATAHPNNWYRFRVNLAFSESAGIGYTVDSVRARVSVTSTGQVALNDLFEVDTHIPPSGRDVLQYTSPLYQPVGAGRVGVTVDFTANITDDRGNSLTASNQVTAMHRGGPRAGIPQ